MGVAVFEVFGQEGPGAAMRHAGSLCAATPELAILLAEELFCRRSEYRALWVVPRDAISRAPQEGDVLGPAEPRGYRLGAGYRATVGKWRRFGGEQLVDR